MQQLFFLQCVNTSKNNMYSRTIQYSIVGCYKSLKALTILLLHTKHYSDVSKAYANVQMSARVSTYRSGELKCKKKKR